MIASLASVKSAAVAVPFLLAGLATAADTPYKVDTRENILKSAKTLAEDLIALYDGNKPGKIPGILPGPPPNGAYYWWQGGFFMDTYLDYFRLTGDDTYNDIVSDGIMHQSGHNFDFMPANWTATLGNDDQCLWATAALHAAEIGLPDVEGKPSWADLAKNAYNTMASPSRWDGTCGGGLRWQVPPTNLGYNYKNSLANACFLNLGARLAKFTGNETYVAKAAETWDWLVKVKYIDTDEYRIFDGGHVEENCTNVNKVQFSLNAAVLLQGAAYLYNQTSDQVWRDRLTKLSSATIRDFFPDGIAYELACEGRKEACSTDMRSFKGIVHRYLATSTEMAPYLAESLHPVLRLSTEAAIKTCTGGKSGRDCGFYWSEKKYVAPEPASDDDVESGVHNVGEQMNVLAAVESLLVEGDMGGPAVAVTASPSDSEDTSETTTGSGDSKTTGTGPAGSGAGRFQFGAVTAAVLGFAVLLVGA
ncbi:glycoside hydrolase [Naviculisporaceae sp. PSN 640]